jgi:hypothetical protein
MAWLDQGVIMVKPAAAPSLIKCRRFIVISSALQ